MMCWFLDVISSKLCIRHWLLTQLGRCLVVLVVCVVPLELMFVIMYTPSHNVVEKVMSPVCHCDRCGQCFAYSITFPESLCGSYWDVKPCKEHFCGCVCVLLFTVLQNCLISLTYIVFLFSILTEAVSHRAWQHDKKSKLYVFIL